jgi:glycosyltransferase involved in cell wall biosynthesis
MSGIAGATLDIIGAGPEAGALASSASRLGLADRVTFRGFVDQGDLPDVYRSFDVVAVPSLPSPGWLEQFCRVAVEAMASGIPVVVTDAWRAALQRLLDEPDLWTSLRRAALERAPSFSWPAVAKAHDHLYEDVAPR